MATIQQHPQCTRVSGSCFVTFQALEKTIQTQKHIVTLDFKKSTIITKDVCQKIDVLSFTNIIIFFATKILMLLFALAIKKTIRN